MVKYIPQFNLVCSTNNPFEIKSNDQGTWRRIKNVPYNAEFVDPDVMENKIASGLTGDPENPIYLKDYELDEKMKRWVQVFTALLIEKCNENEGQVKDCEIILASTKGYRDRNKTFTVSSSMKMLLRLDLKIKLRNKRLEIDLMNGIKMNIVLNHLRHKNCMIT